MSSLIVHHLDSVGKKKLFEDIASLLEPEGALILADLVEPESGQARSLYTGQWDQAVRRQSLERTSSLKAYHRFVDEGWNYYTDKVSDLSDQPSKLAEHLIWLSEAGFRSVDCFWMHAGHAIYGGYR